MRRHEQALLLAAAGVTFALIGLAPLLRLMAEVPAALGATVEALARARPWQLLLRSAGLSAMVTALALAIGTPFGALIARSNIVAPRALWILHALPMFLPPFVLALGWFHVFGSQGLIGSAFSASLLFSEMGVVLVLALAFAPVATSLVAFGILGVDASLEEAARVVAGPWRVATRVLIPAARPALILAAIVVFSLAFSELGVPMFLRVDVYPAVVFARLGGIDYAPGEALALLVPLVPIAFGLLALERRFVGAHALAVSGLRGGMRTRMALGAWRVAASAGCWLFVALSLMPIVALLIRAQRGGGFGILWDWLGQAPLTSLATAIVAATVIAALGVVMGHAVARRVRGSAALDAATVLVFLTPAVVLGVGIIDVWNRPATRLIYGSIAILVVGYVARYAIVGVRCVAATVLQSPAHLEEAAAVSGAGYLRRLRRIVLPINARGVAFAFLMALVFCLRDLETPVLFYPPGHEPLTVRLFTLEANGPPAVVAALAVAQVVLTIGVLCLGMQCFPRRRTP